jgi:hypothetical protein
MNKAKLYSLPLSNTFRVDTEFRIRSLTAGYEIDIQSHFGVVNRVAIDLQPKDIDLINEDLIDALQYVKNAFDPDNKDIISKRDALAKLAEKGKYAFNFIFKGSVRKAIIRALENTKVIQISSENFFIPWELLYVGELGDHIEINDFWGMKYILTRAIIQTSVDGYSEPPVLRSSKFRVGMVSCRDLDAVIETEIPALRKFEKQRKIALSILQTLSTDRNSSDELAKFNDFLCEKREIVHFACHSRTKSKPSQSHFVVEENFNITMENFRTYEFSVEGHPFIILNACRTGTVSPLHGFNWASQFCSIGARGVLAIEFEVPDQFAAFFIKNLYSRILEGKPIGGSLMDTRWHFWNEFQNPLGLAYTLYLSPEIQFIIEEENE